MIIIKANWDIRSIFDIGFLVQLIIAGKIK